MALFGILNVNKPAGRTSRDVVDAVERLSAPARAGHAGTLDPLATGVLVVCVGQATKLITYVQQMPKRYRALFLLGRTSNSDDVEGEVAEIPGALAPSRSEIDTVLPQFTGLIQQRPPAHSAIKVAGRRAYKLARRGQPVELATRPVMIHRIAVLRYEYPELEMEIQCGSGTYVRALGRDLAKALGTGAVMSALQRSAIGAFRIEDAVRVDELTPQTLPSHIQPALVAVADLPRVALIEAELIEIRNGRPIPMRDGGSGVPSAPVSGCEWAAVDSVGRLVALLREKCAGQLWPVKNFQ